MVTTSKVKTNSTVKRTKRRLQHLAEAITLATKAKSRPNPANALANNKTPLLKEHTVVANDATLLFELG